VTATDAPPPRRRRLPDGGPDGKMTLGEHLYELRSRLIRVVLAYAAGFGVSFGFFTPIFRFLESPFCTQHAARVLGRGHCSLIVTGPADAFLIRVQVAMWVAAIGTSPIWLYQLWRFITPGLRRHERRWGVGFVLASLVLFAAGSVLAYLVLGHALAFLLGFAHGTIAPLVTVDKYLSFLFAIVLAFGVAFEVPLLVVLLNAAGVVSYQRLKSWRRAEIVIVAAFAAVATPTGDPITMLALCTPMWLLYEGALLIARAHDKRKAEQAPYADLSDDETSPLQMGEA
jgi:sec-independent protein translocase protein TatC